MGFIPGDFGRGGGLLMAAGHHFFVSGMMVARTIKCSTRVTVSGILVSLGLLAILNITNKKERLTSEQH
jgi:hypothetical protein